MINKIHNEDCLETMARMPDNFIDLTITSPPYDSLRDYKGYSFNFESVAKELYRVTIDGGVVVWVVNDATIKGNETGTSFRQALYFKDVGFRLHDTMIYQKDGIPVNSGNRYEPKFEFMFVFSKGAPGTTNLITTRSVSAGSKKFRGNAKTDNNAEQKRNITTITKDYKIKGNVWYYAVGKNDKTSHPAVFPEALVRDHIVSWSGEGDLIYDPFMGSGTTAKMAALLNRNYVGSEISKQYCEIAEERINKYLSQPAQETMEFA